MKAYAIISCTACMSFNPDQLSVVPDGLPSDRIQMDTIHQVSHNSNRSNLGTGMAAGVPPYGTNNPSAMSAAAAAALLIQAAAGGSANESPNNVTLSGRRCSTSSLLESPQPSPLSSSVISVAAQQAALAAAQAIASPRSPSSSSSASNFQAAVLSLALAASSTCTTISNSSGSEFRECQRSLLGHSAMNDLISLSEQHPKLLTAHSTLASVFRRRSSTLAPPCFTNVLNPVCMDVASKHELKNFSSDEPQLLSFLSPNIASTLDLGNSQLHNNQQLALPDYPEGFPLARHSASIPTSFLNDNCVGQHNRSGESYLMDINSEGPAKIPMKMLITLEIPPLYHTEVTTILTFQPFYKTSPKYDSHLVHPSGVHPSFDRNSSKCNTRYFSPTPTSVSSELALATCPPTSPLSCSSLSNSATPQLNISPLNVECRVKNPPMDDMSGATSRSSISCRSLRTNCGTECDFKTDEPNRKREQRLLKNREAARECRRKKKEYVKCLEARVSLLESQNQQLIEELQKVKALCFKELCGLGLNSSTAACAAAVLAAVTSVSASYPGSDAADASGLDSTARFPSDSDHNLCERSTEAHRMTSDFGEDLQQLHDCPRSTRHRRRSVFTAPKLSPYPPQAAWLGPYSSKCSEPSNVTCTNHVNRSVVEASSHSCVPQLHDTKGDCVNNPVTISYTPPVESDTISPHSGEHLQLHCTESHTALVDGKVDGNRLPQRSTHEISSELQSWKSPQYHNCGNAYQHPRYAAKRAYRSVIFNSPNGNTETEMKTGPIDDKQICEPGNNVDAVTGAAVILAAAAAMVAESESSAPESRLSV
ncbi:Cyclic AMP-dependent transcription factor ATF-1 [Schistosoma japonicum]|uniref:Cyclic AMP-dependent transcription factor ATF-1 n=1 Tax=Schistosoma japonicum TaxID=6182 RepID=A0A4Z2DML7_SCHJA|nr:Cyclic AMP-dependent transcription factor ATF-1 [Schistosoma japonicum]